MKKYIALMFCAWIFTHAETYYFGNNMFPQSWQEVVCDSIGFIGFYLGFFGAIKKALN